MRYTAVSWQKIREVYAEDGATVFLRTGLRYVWGVIHLLYLRRIARKDEFVGRVLGNRMVLRVNDPGIGSELIVRGFREKLATREMQRAVKPGMEVLDLGANIGYYALIEAALVGPEGRVYAFEPIPENHRMLVRNLELNGFQDRARTFQLAMGSEAGTVTMHLSRFSTRHSFAEGPPADAAGTLEVPMVSVDSFVREQGIDLDRLGLIRMDTEGAESSIIPAMRDTLKRCRHVRLFISFHNQVIDEIPGGTFRDCLEVLRSVNARFDLLHYHDGRRKVSAREMSIDQVLASETLMGLKGVETWLTVDNR